MLKLQPCIPFLPFRPARALARLLFALACAAASGASAADSVLGSLQILRPYARPTPPGATTGGAYFSIRNTGRTADRLVAASSPVAAKGEIHEMTMDGGIMRMRALPGVDLPAGATVDFVPGGFHLMLVELRRPLKAGERFPLRLTFAQAGSTDIDVVVQARP